MAIMRIPEWKNRAVKPGRNAIQREQMRKRNRRNVPKRAPVYEGAGIVLRVGETLNLDAYSASGTLLLRAGQVIEDECQLSRLLLSDTRFGDDRIAIAWDVPPQDAHTPIANHVARVIRHSYPMRQSAARQVRSDSEDAKAPAQEPQTPGEKHVPRILQLVDVLRSRPVREVQHVTEAMDLLVNVEPSPIPVHIPEAFQQAYAIKSDSFKQVQSVFDRIESSGTLAVDELEDTVSALMDQVTSDGIAIASLTQLKDTDGYTYSHSVNVCILAMYMSLTTSYEPEIRHIGLGALLHDVGKVTIPVSLLRKRGALDESERRLIQEHPRRGVHLLHNAGCTNAIVLSCVLDHHEKLTGRGYPGRKPACEIGPYAKIVSLADVFDALTTDRPYRKAMSARDALMLMVSEMSPDFDPWLLQRFVDVVGSIADQTYITPAGYVALRENVVNAPVRQIIRVTSQIDGLDAVA
jgi:HD-GYP domain-containing protein (c-di-GMP phosphodiesterase class II)